MRGRPLLYLGVATAGLLAYACGSADTKRKGYEQQGGEAGAADADRDRPGTGEGGAGPAATAAEKGGETAAESGGADGSRDHSSVAGAGSAQAGAPGGSGAFVPEAPRLALGGAHSCARKLDQTVWCWGRGDHGELGDGVSRDAVDPPASAIAVQVSGITSAAQVVAGESHSCALLDAPASVVCWGGAWQGQLGDGSLHDAENGAVTTPQVVSLAGATQISGGANHNCARLGDSSVNCWGYGLFGELGDGSQNNTSAAPVVAKDLLGVTAVAAGEFQSCALLQGGTVDCWGAVGYSNGQDVTSRVPIARDGVSGATAIAAGGAFTCAIVDGGKVQCWGEGDVGQLGNGAADDSNVPVEVMGLTDVVELSAGKLHACALRSDRTLWCWGDGEFGQLGDGVYHNGFPYYVTEPVRAAELDDVTEVACGDDHTCVRTSHDEVLCVGSGRYGELGDGQIYDSLPFGASQPVKALDL